MNFRSPPGQFHHKPPLTISKHQSIIKLLRFYLQHCRTFRIAVNQMTSQWAGRLGELLWKRVLANGCSPGSVAWVCSPSDYGGMSWRTAWGWELCGDSTCVDRASALSLASIWRFRGSPECPGCLRRNVPGQARKGAAKSSHAVY